MNTIAAKATTTPRNGRFRWLVRYELFNLFGVIYVPFFGLVFPLLMSFLLANTALLEVPAAFRQEAVSRLVLSMLQMVPLAAIFLGHGALYSQEQEKQVPLRLELFGLTPTLQMLAKMTSQIIFMTFALAVNLGILIPSLNVLRPTPAGFSIVLLSMYLMAVILFMLAHGIANWIRKFGPTYAIVMLLYFAFMILGGMMGMSSSKLPGPVRFVAELLPYHYITEDFLDVWQGKSYNFAPFIQAMLLLTAVSALVMVSSFIYRRHRSL
ncbi:MAG: ABC transporter permease [Bacillota bacterium]|nr:ABC transporter permease [Bacillota bacterium]